MHIALLAAGTRMPSWVAAGYDDYAKRLPPQLGLRLNEIPIAKRTKGGPVARLIEEEGARMLNSMPRGACAVALDREGRNWTTRELAAKLSDWMQEGRDVALLIGGPDGLAAACLQRAEHRWSLSELTLPHGLVRVIVAEQIYRAWSILSNHPYHRE